MAEKRVQITSHVRSQVDYSYQRVHQHESDQTTTIEKTSPYTSSSTVTLTTNPYIVETQDPADATKANGGSSSTVNYNKAGYDTSQL
jgi:hypothetical protein